MKLKFRSIPWLCLLAGLAACSGGDEKSTTRQSESQPPAQAQAPAPAPVPDKFVAVSPDLLAHLMRPDSPVVGPVKAPVTVVEFLDPACEACRAFDPVVKQIQFLYPTQVRVVVRFADFHPGSDGAIRLLLAAHKQRKLEHVLAALFDAQEQWASHHSPNVKEAWKIASATGLNIPQARRDALSDAVTERLRQEAEDVLALQVSRTPTFYVNGKLLVEFGPEQLMTLVKQEVALATGARPEGQ